MITLYHNNTCSKSLCALTILEESGKPFTIINYLETPPSATELNGLLEQLGMHAFDLIRKNEQVYKEHYEGKHLSDPEWITAMVEHPILIERPIVVTEKGAVVARPAEKMFDII
jgi:arsenate reductase